MSTFGVSYHIYILCTYLYNMGNIGAFWGLQKSWVANKIKFNEVTDPFSFKILHVKLFI
jgi:hypothetical protein